MAKQEGYIKGRKRRSPTRLEVLAALAVLYIVINSRGRIDRLEQGQRELVKAVEAHNQVLEIMNANRGLMDQYFGPRAS